MLCSDVCRIVNSSSFFLCGRLLPHCSVWYFYATRQPTWALFATSQHNPSSFRVYFLSFAAACCCCCSFCFYFCHILVSFHFFHRMKISKVFPFRSHNNVSAHGWRSYMKISICLRCRASRFHVRFEAQVQCGCCYLANVSIVWFNCFLVDVTRFSFFFFHSSSSCVCEKRSITSHTNINYATHNFNWSKISLKLIFFSRVINDLCKCTASEAAECRLHCLPAFWRFTKINPLFFHAKREKEWTLRQSHERRAATKNLSLSLECRNHSPLDGLMMSEMMEASTHQNVHDDHCRGSMECGNHQRENLPHFSREGES